MSWLVSIQYTEFHRQTLQKFESLCYLVLRLKVKRKLNQINWCRHFILSYIMLQVANKILVIASLHKWKWKFVLLIMWVFICNGINNSCRDSYIFADCEAVTPPTHKYHTLSHTHNTLHWLHACVEHVTGPVQTFTYCTFNTYPDGCNASIFNYLISNVTGS